MKIPIDLKIRPLRVHEWAHIADRYKTVFENGIPDPRTSVFFGVFIGEKIVGFLHLETVVHLNCVYLDPEYRNQHFADALFDMVNSETDPNVPMIALPDKNWRTTLRQFGFRLLGKMDVWRRDM